LSLIDFITDFPTHVIQWPLNSIAPDKHIFVIASNNPCYDIILNYLYTLSFDPHLSQDDHQDIHHWCPCYLLLKGNMYQWGVDIIVCQFLTQKEVKQVLNRFHGMLTMTIYQEWPSPKRSFMWDICWLSFHITTFMRLIYARIVKFSPLKPKHNLLLHIPLSLLTFFATKGSTLWNVTLYPIVTTSRLLVVT